MSFFSVPDEKEVAREARRRLKEERQKRKERKRNRKAKLEKECLSEKMNCFRSVTFENELFKNNFFHVSSSKPFLTVTTLIIGAQLHFGQTLHSAFA